MKLNPDWAYFIVSALDSNDKSVEIGMTTPGTILDKIEATIRLAVQNNDTICADGDGFIIPF